MKTLHVTSFVVVAISVATAQGPEFEAATVKASTPVSFGTPISINLGTFRNGTFTLANVTLSECVQFAYGMVAQEQIAGPDWIKSREVRFDIVAKTAVDAEVEQVRRMLQTLLADRLKLVIHREPRLLSFLALVPARGGPKLVPAPSGPPGAPNTSTRGRIVGSQMPMPVLASLLSRFERQLVIDRTGLTGGYQLKLEWAPEDLTTKGDVSAGPSLFAALEEQLGLRLESRREPLDVIVVDQAEKTPADN
jgi:uncharacterized protein (TIGR03435 family)